MLAPPKLEKWLRRAHAYLETARTRGMHLAEAYRDRFEDKESFDAALKLIGDGAARAREK